MNTFSQSGLSTSAPSISDLDGYTLRDYPFTSSYAPADSEEFGFDPPTEAKREFTRSKLDQTYSPPEHNDGMAFGGWPGFEREEDLKRTQQGVYDLDKLLSQNLPNTATAITRFGQVTPPRTNSSDSGAGTEPNSNTASPKTDLPERRKRAKPAPKQPEASATSTAGRKRKGTRKSVANTEQTPQAENLDDPKRKASLEKNRLAAAKCRVNKKEKTEQLQRDSHDKAVHNAFLKEQIVHMREEIQQMNAVLLAHANCKGCKAPDDIQKHLSQLGNEFLANQMAMGNNSFPDFNQMAMDDLSEISQPPFQDGYFQTLGPHGDSDLLNPPLPEFDRSADFDVHTPMITD